MENKENAPKEKEESIISEEIFNEAKDTDKKEPLTIEDLKNLFK